MPQSYWEIFTTSLADSFTDTLAQIGNPSLSSGFYLLVLISLYFMVLEYFTPWKKDQPVFRKEFWLDAWYMFFNVFIFALIGYYALSNVVVAAFNDFLLIFGIENIIALNIQQLALWQQLLLLFVARDFLEYWVHRMLHRVDFLWEFHKVHHSAKELSFATNFRHHWMETVIYRTCEYIPLAMLGYGIQHYMFVFMISLIIGHFTHSNIHLPFGKLGYIFNNPQFHWWHHAETDEKKHPYGTNFSVSFTFWDYLFGTAYYPNEEAKANVKLGFTGIETYPTNFWGQIMHPFRRKQKKQEVIKASPPVIEEKVLSN